jgi:predicted ATPase
MRIAISGSHGTGKSTLLRELATHLDGYETVDEAYHLLDSAGCAFRDPPTDDDFVALVDYAASLFSERSTGDALFDRSPADYLAYLAAAYPDFVRDEHIAATAAALATLDLVVFVPIERPDRIHVGDAPKLRRRVDRVLREMLVEGAWPFSARVVEVSGSIAQRAQQVLTALAGRAPGAPV